MAIGKYLRWKDAEGNAFRPVSLSGTELLNDRTLNKSTAFSEDEREQFDLIGLLPPRVQTFDDQLNRVYAGFKSASTDIEKYLFLRALQDRNETLFYALLSQHIAEMTPIIYTPTVGKACQEFSHRYQKARGLYITPDNVDQMGKMSRQFIGKDIRIIVVTDSQGILGIGDQGVGGMAIPIGKLSLYTLAAGIHPAHCLPIALDVGTDNEKLLNDPMYLGVPTPRLVKQDYQHFIASFVDQVKRHFPKAVLQWEDFSKSNAFDNLSRYQSVLPSFNDDIQGTGAVVLAGVLNAVAMKKEALSDQVFAVFGAGAGGVGIANQIYAALLSQGISELDARSQIYLLDSQGVIFDDRANLDTYKHPYAKPAILRQKWGISAASVDLLALLNAVPITVLLGASGIVGAFQEDHIQKMMEYTSRPIVFPLSNPTENSEATPHQLYLWSDQQAIVATGSPFDDVSIDDRVHHVGQGNNVFIFPGVGLACMVSQAKILPMSVFTIAAFALADSLTEQEKNRGCIYPNITRLRDVSDAVAKAVLEHLVNENLTALSEKDNLSMLLIQQRWEPMYLPYRRV
jgi:malate dehydrogenase (oxaloacetate-decarboxylating)/malate dehydrogenase (oxaloacetate-decarboxylating)(NADP+)